MSSSSLVDYQVLRDGNFVLNERSVTMKRIIFNVSARQLTVLLSALFLVGCSHFETSRDFNGAKDQFARSLGSAFDQASERFGVTVDTETLVAATHRDGFIAVASIPSSQIAEALVHFSFPDTDCGSNALRPDFYRVVRVKDQTGALVGVRHLDEFGKEVITIPLDRTISHHHEHTTGTKIVTGSDEDPTAAVSVFAWYNTKLNGTHIEYDLTNGQCCPFPGC